VHGVVLVLALAASVTPPAYADQQPAAVARAPVPATDAEQEAFLLEARVVKTRGAGGGGITGALRATLRQGDVEHDALVQSIDEEKPYLDLPRGRELEFRDTYKGNAAAYRLDRLLGLGMVPVTVVRPHEGKRSGFTWWVDDVQMDERARLAKKLAVPDVEAWNRQMWVVRLFDQLIYNTDRNLGNLLIDKDWRLWMIDHTRAFKTFTAPKSPRNLATQCERGLLLALRGLDQATLAEAMHDLLTEGQVKGLLARRDFIVKHYDERIRRAGEAAVLYDLPSRARDKAPPGSD
jgi:hypothetical protein